MTYFCIQRKQGDLTEDPPIANLNTCNMKTIPPKKFHLRLAFLLMTLFAGVSVNHAGPYTQEPCDHQNVFTLTAKMKHNKTVCTKGNESMPHHFVSYSATIIHKKTLEGLKNEANLLAFYFSANLQEDQTSSLDLPLVDHRSHTVLEQEYLNVNLDEYYAIICLRSKLAGNSSEKPLYEDAAQNIDQLRQSPIPLVPVNGSCHFEYNRPALIKVSDLLKSTLSTHSYNPGCETVEFHLQTKCSFIINDTKTVYQGYPYNIILEATQRCSGSSFTATPETYPAYTDFSYSTNMFRWEYTHGGIDRYLPLNRPGKITYLNAMENPDMPVGENLLVKVMDGRESDPDNTQAVCFYPDLPQPTNTGFQRIPEGQTRLQELRLKFNRTFDNNMEERPTLLTVYSKVGQQTDGSIKPNESMVIFQETMDMSRFDGLFYTTSVANRPMPAGTYYVTVEGTVRQKSNHPDQNGSLPGNIKTAMFQVVPILVGQNDIDIEKIEFTPPVCYGEKGKLKLTIAGCFLPYVSSYPIFYYRTGKNPDGNFTYDTIHFRCTYPGTQNNRHATFECDHISALQTHFKIIIPPIVQTAPGTTVPLNSTLSGSTTSANTNSSSDSFDNQTAYFQIEFTQPDQLDFPVKVKHNSGYYYVNRQLKIADDGQITVSRKEAVGGTPPYSFFFRDDFANLTDKNLTDDVLQTPNIGKRYITIKDSKGCSLTKTIAVGNLNGILFVKLDIERDISCYNANDGILKASAEKQAGNPIRYSWYKNGVLLPGKTSSMLYDLGPGTYRVVMTDTETGMASSDEATLTQPSMLRLSMQQKTDVDCFGNHSGSLALKGAGGVSPYLYLWNGVDYGSIRRNLPAGEYQVRLIDHNSCELTQTYTIGQPEKAFEIGIDSVIHAHYGIDGEYIPGSILLHPQGGTEPYGALETNATDLKQVEPGTYRLAQSDARQCRDEKEVEVHAFEKMEIQIIQDSKIMCFGEKTASCHVEITGGVPPFDILWSNGDTQASIDSMSAGAYSVRVMDAAKVIQTKSIVIPTPSMFLIDSLSTKNPIYHGCTNDLCLPGDTDGKIDFAVTGGTRPYSLQWKKDGNDISPISPDNPNLAAGEYELHAIDDNGCEANQIFRLTAIEPLHARIEILQTIDCHGNNNGIIRANVSGGTPPYRYTWENRQDTTAAIEGLPSGIYKFSVSDALGVQASTSLFLDEPTPLRIIVDSVRLPSYPGSHNGKTFERIHDGKIQVTIAGGTAPYLLSWTDSANLPIGNMSDPDGLSSGIYHLRVRDHAGCIADTTFRLPHTEALQCSAVIEKAVSCFGFSDATLRADIQGGKRPYSIKWLKDDNDSIGNLFLLENLACAGYTLSVTDSMGVQASFQTYLSQPDSLQLKLVAQHGLCHQDSGGSAVAVIQGGTYPYTYHWNMNGKRWSSEDSTLSHIENAEITLKVNDSRGCGISTSATVTAPHALELEYLTVNPSYAGSKWKESLPETKDGKIELYAHGGTEPYRFFWNETEGGALNEGLDSGTYPVTVQDANLCRHSKTIRLQRTPNLTTRLDLMQEPLCADSATGAFRLSVLGGVGPYTFDWYKDGKWIGEDSVCLRRDIGAGVYKILVLDANGIESRDSLVVHEPERISAKARIEDATAWTIANGSIHTEILGGVSPYTLLWNNGSQEQSIGQLRHGIYTLDIVDANRCHSAHRFTVNSPDSLFISSLVIQHCHPDRQDGSVKLSIQGGLPPYLFHWKDANGNIIRTGSSVRKLMESDSLAPGSYRFHLKDSGGAEIDRLFEIEKSHRLEAMLLIENPIHCHGERTAIIQAWIRGGREPYSCIWQTTPDSLQEHIHTYGDRTRLENLPAGTYRITVRDADGDTCSSTISIIPTQALSILADLQPAESSDTLNDGCIILRPQGGHPPYRYLWNTGNTSSIQNYSRSGHYRATVTDAEGCTAGIDIDSVISKNLQIRLHQTASIFCHGDTNGALHVEIQNGKPPFSIRWSNGTTSQDNRNLSAGLYTVRITDAMGRNDSGSFLIRQPEKLANVIMAGAPSCHGFSDGRISLSTTGGRAPYSYAWNTGAYTHQISGLRKGSYIVRVSDRLHCIRTDTIVLHEPEMLRSILHIDSIACPDGKGLIRWQAEGGTTPYSYRWIMRSNRTSDTLTGGRKPLIDPAPSGWYDLHVTDSNRCSSDTGVFLSNPLPPSYQLDREKSLCIGQSLLLKPDGCDTTALQCLWVYPDGSASSRLEIQTRTSGLHKLTLIQNHRCIYRDSVDVRAFDDSIHAEFWVSSQISARQNCLLVNLSEYRPDSITWHLPENVRILNQEGNYLEVRFPASGTYTVGMTSYKGECSESIFRQVEVSDEQNRHSGHTSSSRIRWHITPNPTHGNCLLAGESDRSLYVRYRLVKASTGHITDHGNFHLGKDGKINRTIFRGQETSGMYILLLEYGNEKQSFKIVKL